MKNQVSTAEVKPKKRKRGKMDGLAKSKAISGYLFILPFIIGFLAFMVKPLFHSLYMSFCDVILSSGNVSYSPIGIENYRFALRTDPEYLRLLTEELTRMLI